MRVWCLSTGTAIIDTKILYSPRQFGKKSHQVTAGYVRGLFCLRVCSHVYPYAWFTDLPLLPSHRHQAKSPGKRTVPPSKPQIHCYDNDRPEPSAGRPTFGVALEKASQRSNKITLELQPEAWARVYWFEKRRKRTFQTELKRTVSYWGNVRSVDGSKKLGVVLEVFSYQGKANYST